MRIADLSSLAAVVLAGSLTMERLVTIVKTVAPRRFAEPVHPPINVSELIADRGRRLRVLALVFSASLLTAYVLAEPATACKSGAKCASLEVQYGTDLAIPWLLFAFLISGGSAFWANIVGYTSALKDVRIEQKRVTRAATQSIVADNREAIIEAAQRETLRLE
jgi:hypothetical protein